jgi:hypothetical protein
LARRQVGPIPKPRLMLRIRLAVTDPLENH